MTVHAASNKLNLDQFLKLLRTTDMVVLKVYKNCVIFFFVKFLIRLSILTNSAVINKISCSVLCDHTFITKNQRIHFINITYTLKSA